MPPFDANHLPDSMPSKPLTKGTGLPSFIHAHNIGECHGEQQQHHLGMQPSYLDELFEFNGANDGHNMDHKLPAFDTQPGEQDDSSEDEQQQLTTTSSYMTRLKPASFLKYLNDFEGSSKESGLVDLLQLSMSSSFYSNMSSFKDPGARLFDLSNSLEKRVKLLETRHKELAALPKDQIEVALGMNGVAADESNGQLMTKWKVFLYGLLMLKEQVSAMKSRLLGVRFKNPEVMYGLLEEAERLQRQIDVRLGMLDLVTEVHVNQGYQPPSAAFQEQLEDDKVWYTLHDDVIKAESALNSTISSLKAVLQKGVLSEEQNAQQTNFLLGLVAQHEALSALKKYHLETHHKGSFETSADSVAESFYYDEAGSNTTQNDLLLKTAISNGTFKPSKPQLLKIIKQRLEKSRLLVSATDEFTQPHLTVYTDQYALDLIKALEQDDEGQETLAQEISRIIAEDFPEESCNQADDSEDEAEPKFVMSEEALGKIVRFKQEFEAVYKALQAASLKAEDNKAKFIGLLGDELPKESLAREATESISDALNRTIPSLYEKISDPSDETENLSIQFDISRLYNLVDRINHEHFMIEKAMKLPWISNLERAILIFSCFGYGKEDETVSAEEIEAYGGDKEQTDNSIPWQLLSITTGFWNKTSEKINAILGKHFIETSDDMIKINGLLGGLKAEANLINSTALKLQQNLLQIQELRTKHGSNNEAIENRDKRLRSALDWVHLRLAVFTSQRFQITGRLKGDFEQNFDSFNIASFLRGALVKDLELPDGHFKDMDAVTYNQLRERRIGNGDTIPEWIKTLAEADFLMPEGEIMPPVEQGSGLSAAAHEQADNPIAYFDEPIDLSALSSRPAFVRPPSNPMSIFTKRNKLKRLLKKVVKETNLVKSLLANHRRMKDKKNVAPPKSVEIALRMETTQPSQSLIQESSPSEQLMNIVIATNFCGVLLTDEQATGMLLQRLMERGVDSMVISNQDISIEQARMITEINIKKKVVQKMTNLVLKSKGNKGMTRFRKVVRKVIAKNKSNFSTPASTLNPKSIIFSQGSERKKDFILPAEEDPFSDPVIFGRQSAEFFAKLTVEKLQPLRPDFYSAINSVQLSSIEPEALSALKTEQLAALKDEAVRGMSKEQAVRIPRTAWSGLTPAQLNQLGLNFPEEKRPIALFEEDEEMKKNLNEDTQAIIQSKPHLSWWQRFWAWLTSLF